MWTKEPALIVGFVGAAIALGVSFGLPVSAEQVGFIMALVTAGLAFVTRSQVTPVTVPPTPLEAVFTMTSGTVMTVPPVFTQTSDDPAPVGVAPQVGNSATGVNGITTSNSANNPGTGGNGTITFPPTPPAAE